MKNLSWVLIAGVIIILAVSFLGRKRGTPEDEYRPIVNARDFSANVSNPYFTLVPGTKFVYEAVKSEGKEKIEVTVLNETKVVMGVEARVVKDQVFLDGELIEDTLDWYAQDKEGNVWYFGEETAEYEDGKVTTTAGSWEGGVDGAQPGIAMKANPQVGDSYWQEFYKGEAEDRADVLALAESVTVPYGTFSDCLKTYDYTPLDPAAREHKYYCKGVGFVTLEVNLEDNGRTELVSVTQ